MNHRLLHTAVHRRKLLGGFALICSLSPSLVAAQGGLKGAGAEQESDDEFSAIGVTGEHSYQSPQFGYRLEWDRHWFVPEDDPGESNRVDQWDTLRIRWTEPSSPLVTPVQIEFSGFTAQRQTLNSWLEGMADPETLTGFFGFDTHEASVALVAQESGFQEVVWQLDPLDDDEDLISMVSAYRVLDDGLVLMTTMAIFDPEELTNPIASLIDDVLFEDEPLMQLLSLEDIEAAFADLD